MVIPIFAILLIIQGRLVFPVFNIDLSPSGVELIVSLWYGGLHAVYELMAGATILVIIDLKKMVFGKNIAYLGFIIGASDLAGAYPWLIGPKAMLICQSLFSLWFVIIGLKLYKIKNKN